MKKTLFLLIFLLSFVSLKAQFPKPTGVVSIPTYQMYRTPADSGIHIYQGPTNLYNSFLMKWDSIKLKGWVSNYKLKQYLLQYRKLNNHDSLSKLDERKYQSLTDTLIWGLGLNQLWHTVKVDTADISIPSRQRIAKYYRLINDTIRLKGTATVFDLLSKINVSDTTAMLQNYINEADTSVMLSKYATDVNLSYYTLKNDSSKYYEKLVNKTLNVTTDGASDIKYPSAKAVKTYADSKVADVITDGVTTIAPAENAVFDALALKYDGSGTAGQVAFHTAARTLSGDNGLFWDNMNKRLGIGTKTPGGIFEIHSTTYDALTAYSSGIADSKGAVGGYADGDGASNYIGSNIYMNTAGSFIFFNDTKPAWISLQDARISIDKYTIGRSAANVGGNPSITNFVTVLNDGSVGICTTPLGKLDVAYGGYAGTAGLMIGADIGALTSRTNATRKYATIAAPHYTNVQANIGILSLDAQVSASILNIGTVTGNFNAPTEIRFWTAANNTTTTTTQQIVINNTGVGFGYADPETYRAKFYGTGYFSGNFTANAFIKIGGTSAQYLLADGSVTTSAGSVYKGEVDGDDGVPLVGGSALADGTGTTAWYYACADAGTFNYDAAHTGHPIALAVGDQIYYNGTIWIKIPGAGSYTLPIATASLGGVVTNTNVSVNASTGGMIVLTNANLTGDVTSSGNTTTIAAQNSAFWAGKITDESGTGVVAFTTSPVFTTPNIGSATGSISGNAATVTTNANLTGVVTSVGNATSFAVNPIFSGKIETVGSTDPENEIGTLMLRSSGDITRKIYFGYSDTYNAGWISSIQSGSSYRSLLLNPISGNVLIGYTANPAAYKAAINGTLYTNGVISTVATGTSTDWNKYNQWDGGATGLVAATGRTSLGLGTAATTAATAYEPALGNPGTTGYVLSSTTAGVRSWVAQGGGSHTLDSHSNVTITSNASGELLKWNGSAWINNTLAEAGIQPLHASLTSIAGLTEAAGTLIYGTADNAYATLAAGATTTILVGGGAAAPVWTTATGTGAPVRAGSPTFTGTVSGSVASFSSTMTATNFILSDRRLKTKPRPISDLSKFDNIKFYQFSMLSDTTHRLRYGAMADEVELIAKELVNTAQDSMKTKSVNYTDMLIGIVARQAELIKALEKRLEKLEK